MALMHPSSSTLSYPSGSVRPFLNRYDFASGNDPDDDASTPASFGRRTAPREDLPYRVELWDEARKAVEQVLAVTANAGIGYAAYYAATREHPQRYITLRHKNHIVSRWNGPDH
jgi:hypothetical protein